MLEIMFELPSRKDVTKFTLTKEMVDGIAFTWPDANKKPTAKSGGKKVAVAAKRRRKRREAS